MRLVCVLNDVDNSCLNNVKSWKLNVVFDAKTNYVKPLRFCFKLSNKVVGVKICVFYAINKQERETNSSDSKHESKILIKRRKNKLSKKQVLRKLRKTCSFLACFFRCFEKTEK